MKRTFAERERWTQVMERCKRLKQRDHHVLQAQTSTTAVHAPFTSLGAAIEQLFSHHVLDTTVPGEEESVPGDAIFAEVLKLWVVFLFKNSHRLFFLKWF